MSDLEAVLAQARERVVPDDDEREHLEAVAQTVLDRAAEATNEHAPAADVVHVGSSARDTWLPGDQDIDVFVRFPPDTDRETLETTGLEIGHAVLPEGREQYAEHPYVSGPLEGIEVDVVPCYRLESATDVRSAVDRTPFHDAYLRERLEPETTTEVRLGKAFLTAAGIYGSDLRTRGFGGYLTELLVADYGSFGTLLEAVADWSPPVELDPADHAATAFDDRLVVVDPTDPERNVAAVCSPESVARFQHYAREFLAEPTLEAFEPTEPSPLAESELAAHLERRETTLVALHFDPPDLVDDQLWPQLRKTERGIVDELGRLGFLVGRSTVVADETAAVLLDCQVAALPAMEIHEGPPVHVRDHAEGFWQRYVDDPTVYGPSLEGDRYVVEREREVRTVQDWLASDALFGAGLGTQLEPAIREDRTVLVGTELSTLLPEFGSQLRTFLEPSV